MFKHCIACGMPLMKKEDFAGGDDGSTFCVHCVNPDGKVKSCGEIFEGGVEFFMSQAGADRKAAEKVTRKNMNRLPYWQDSKCDVLKGETATDEEFAAVLKKLA